jgi:hypothetical protein
MMFSHLEEMLALKVGPLMSALRKTRSHRISLKP